MEKYLRAESLTHRNNVRSIKAHAEVHEFAHEVARKHWSEKMGFQDDGSRHYSVNFSAAWAWDAHVDLSCYLSKIDSLKNDTLDLLEAILDSGWEVDSENLEQSQQWKCWRFNHPGKKYKTADGGLRGPNLRVYFYFGNSENCRVVGTGEFEQKEITEVICEG